MRRAVGRRLDVLSRQLIISSSSAGPSPLSGTRHFTSTLSSMASNGDKPGATPAALKVDPKDTIFAKIVDGSIPAKKVFEDDSTIAFHDISPQAPTHILVIPKKPIGGVGDVKQDEESLVGHLMFVATQVAREQGLGEDGYRLVINEGANGQQSVRWLHIHLLGGRKMNWPPG